MNSETKYEYTYSAKEQAEIKKIREKYSHKEDKMEQLRRLDASVTKKGTLLALIVGIISCLILGVGMCCCLIWNLFLPGVIIGVLGIIGISLAYPLYSHITKKEQKRIAPEILRLTDELMK